MLHSHVLLKEARKTSKPPLTPKPTTSLEIITSKQIKRCKYREKQILAVAYILNKYIYTYQQQYCQQLLYYQTEKEKIAFFFFGFFFCYYII
jgi:hypothetical protein